MDLASRPFAYSWVLALTLLWAPSGALAQSGAVVYEYAYPYNTPDLIENHHIALEAGADGWSGWYWGTSDEFDRGREGYLPGFFVAPLTDLRVSATEIAFTIVRPERFFTASVPLEYRNARDVPSGRLVEWSIPLTTDTVRYTGSRTADGIVLRTQGGDRVFRVLRATAAAR